MPSEVTCSNCATVSPAGTATCPKCGTTLRKLATGAVPAIAVKRPRATGQHQAADGSVPLEDGQTNSGRSDPLIGQKLQEYVIRQRIGVGGMGIVYRAEQTMIGKQVAIKVLRPDVVTDPRDMERLLDEARIINSINHRGIINIFSAGTTDNGRHYLIMELLEGESLEDRMTREGIINYPDAVIILEETLSALAAAHAAGIVHRDLKPANVFLAKEGTRFYVKLLDFGLARRQQANVTRIAGTPDYISPEHARGKVAGPPSDLYAFGILCFHMLTGKLPFEGTTPMEVMEKHVHSPPPVAHDVNPTIPQALSDLIVKLLAKDPLARPDANQVKADLKAATRQLRNASTQAALESVSAEPPPRPSAKPANAAAKTEAVSRAAPTSPAGPTRSKLPVIAAGLVGLVVLATVGLAFALKTPSGANARPTEIEPVANPVQVQQPDPTTVKPVQNPVAVVTNPDPIPDEEIDAGPPLNPDDPMDDEQRAREMRQLGLNDPLITIDVNLKSDKFPAELKPGFEERLTIAKQRLEKARSLNQLIDMNNELRALQGDIEKAAATNFKSLDDDTADAATPTEQ